MTSWEWNDQLHCSATKKTTKRIQYIYHILCLQSVFYSGKTLVLCTYVDALWPISTQSQTSCDSNTIKWGFVEILGSWLHSWGGSVLVSVMLQYALSCRGSQGHQVWQCHGGVSPICEGLGADSVYHLTFTKIQALGVTSRILYYKRAQASFYVLDETLEAHQ